SIDQGPFELGTTRDALGTTPEGGVLLGPERPRTYEDLSDTSELTCPNQATIQDGRVVVQNVQGRQNQNQRYFARGNGTAGNGGAQNRAGNANACQGKPDKMLLMQAQEKGAVLDEEELLFLADKCDAFDSDVDDEPTAQSIFMANLSSVGSTNPQVGSSNASILSEVHTLENTIDHSVSNQDEYKIHNKVQPSDVINTTSVHMGNRSGYHQKDRKPSQNDKTEHGMEKTVQNQGQSPKMPKSESIESYFIKEKMV
ncbi:hypothetical protein Tco_1489557, partial [Tanacetum coccineum]